MRPYSLDDSWERLVRRFEEAGKPVPLRWLAFEDEIERASLANQIFAPPFPTDEKLDLARAAGVDYIIVPTRWGFYDSDAMYQLQQDSPEMVALRNESSIVLVP